MPCSSTDAHLEPVLTDGTRQPPPIAEGCGVGTEHTDTGLRHEQVPESDSENSQIVQEDLIQTHELEQYTAEQHSLQSTQLESLSPAERAGDNFDQREALHWPWSPPGKKKEWPKPPFNLNMTEAYLIADLQSAAYCRVRSFALCVLYIAE